MNRLKVYLTIFSILVLTSFVSMEEDETEITVETNFSSPSPENGTENETIFNETVVSINVMTPEEAQEAEERRQAEEGEALNFCEEPSSTDQFLYLFVFTQDCYAFSGSGPQWAAMTGYAFDEDGLSSPTKRISGKDRRNNSAAKNETTIIYSCGNGKKLPPFAPIVHILNASWFLHASTTKGDEKEKTDKEGEEKKTEDDGKNETTSLNETSPISTNGTVADRKESKIQNKSNPDEDWCMMVNFYSPSCPFSARLAPFYNALPRVFPKLLYIAAVDATESSRLNLIYGVAGTPTVMLFHNGKPVARLDDGEFALQRLVMFISQRTDLKPLLNVDVETEDLHGPLPSIPIRGVDYYLVLAWIFLVACALYYGARSSVAQRLWETIHRNWREMEEEQEHLNAARR